eukprot:5083158-Prymnesium_polylepis.2
MGTVVLPRRGISRVGSLSLLVTAAAARFRAGLRPSSRDWLVCKVVRTKSALTAFLDGAEQSMSGGGRSPAPSTRYVQQTCNTKVIQ